MFSKKKKKKTALLTQTMFQWMKYVRGWQLISQPWSSSTGSQAWNEGGLSWLRQGPYGEVWGWGWIGWSRSTKEACGDPNAPSTCLGWWSGDGSTATCHIIVDTGGRTRHSDSASMTDGKLPIGKRDCLPLSILSSAARRESSACGCISELNSRWLFHRWWIGAQTQTRWHYFTEGFQFFHLLVTWCELRAVEQRDATIPRINHNTAVKLVQTLYFHYIQYWFTA